MPVLRIERLRRPLLIACLTAAVLFVTALGWEAIAAARAQREAVEDILRDYAALAAQQYALNVSVTLDYEWLLPTLRVVDATFAAGQTFDPDAEVAGQRDTYTVADAANGFFRLDPADARADAFLGGSRRPAPAESTDPGDPAGVGLDEPAKQASPAEASLFRAILLRLAQRQDEQEWPYVAFLRGRGDAAEYVVLQRAVATGDSGDAEQATHGAVQGFIANLPMLRAFLTGALDVYSLLPATLLDGQSSLDIVQVRVLDPAGNTLFAHGPSGAPAPSAAADLPARLGALRVVATIPATSAERLVVGGLPYSRLPLVAGMLAMTLALLAAGALLWRREQELIRLREEFVAGASHELRTPLAQIRMFAETLQLQRVRSNDEQRRSVEVIDREARRLSVLVENLLRFSSAGRPAQRFVPEDVDIRRLAQEVVAELRPLAAARGASIELVVAPEPIACAPEKSTPSKEVEATPSKKAEAAPSNEAALDDEKGRDMGAGSLPSYGTARPPDLGLRVRGDRDMLHQVLVNLLDNAVKYGREGQTVRIELQAQDDVVCVSVTDQGPGIPAAERSLVWQRFWRGAGVNGITGTGIGLALVRDLVELHGGSTSVEPGPDGGARFVVTLPRRES